jgi:hypothetical protein
MKKESCVIVLLCLVSVFLIGMVDAQGISDGLARGSFGIAEIAVSAFGPFFAALLGGDAEYLFEKVMLFFIIISIVYMTVRKMDVFRDNSAIIFIVTFAVSILATRFFMISDLLVNTVLLPYSVLGVALSAFLPLLIGFAFIHNFDSGFLRKAFWIFFIVVFVAMWDLRYTEVGGISWIYFWSAILSLLFFLFDGTIRRAMIREELKTVAADNQEDFARTLRRELKRLQRDFSEGVVSEKHYERTKRKLERQLKKVMKW